MGDIICFIIKAAKLIHRIPSKMNESEFLDTVDWKPLSYLYKRRSASTMFQMHIESMPKYIIDLLERKDSSIHEVRSKYRFIQNKPRTELGRRTIGFRGPFIWSVIPPEMKDLMTWENFKRKLKSCGKKLNLVQFDKGQIATTFMDSRYKYL